VLLIAKKANSKTATIQLTVAGEGEALIREVVEEVEEVKEVVEDS
jgi:hypothetical protein